MQALEVTIPSGYLGHLRCTIPDVLIVIDFMGLRKITSMVLHPSERLPGLRTAAYNRVTLVVILCQVPGRTRRARSVRLLSAEGK